LTVVLGVYFQESFSAVFSTRGAFLQKLWLQDLKLWTQKQMKQEVFSSVDDSSLDDVICDGLAGRRALR